MRKVFWCCASLAVLAGAAVYLGADYVNRQPESVLGRCLITTLHIGTHCNPVYRVTRTAAVEASEIVQLMKKVLHEDDKAPNVLPVEEIPDDPHPLAEVPVCGEHAAHCAAPEVEAEEPVRPAPQVGKMVGKIVLPLPEDESPAPPLAPLPGGEEADALPPTMPPACDSVRPPATMPYAEDEDTDCHMPSFVEFWWGMCQGVASHCPMHDDAEDCEHGVSKDESEDVDAPCTESHCPNHDHCGKMDSSSSPACDHETGIIPAVEESTEPTQPADKESAPPESGSDAGCPKKSSVDTMEFRRSDAGPDEFDPFPY